MKTFCVALSFALWGVFCLPQAANAQLVSANLQVSGLTCSMCSFATQKQLQTLPFIDSIGTDIEHSSYMLYFKKEIPVEIDQIKSKVEDAGFAVAGLKISYNFVNEKVENDFHLEYQQKLYHFMSVKPQTLNGPVSLRILDKGFITDKEYRKRQKETLMPCYKTGKMPDVDRVYHVTLA